MKRLLLLACTFLFSINSVASDLAVSDQYIRATPPHAKNSASFLTITNHTNTTIKLIAADSDIAKRVELHNHIKQDGMMKMRQVEAVEIAANSSTSLQPGGYHIMFLGLNNNLTEGQSVKVTLYFDNGNELNIDAPVKKINSNKNQGSTEMSHQAHH